MSLREDEFREEASIPGSSLATVEEARRGGGAAARDNPAAPAARPAVTAPRPEASKPSPGPLRKRVLALVALAALACGSWYGWDYWTTGRFFVSTDDAYVQADISVLAAKVPGYLAAVPVMNGQTVRQGEIVARLDDGDYRLALQAAQDKFATQASSVVRIGRQIEAAQAQVLQSAAQIDASRADARRAANDYSRASQIQSDFIAKARLDQTKADRDRTEAGVKGAEAALISAKANVDVLAAQQREAENIAKELATAVDRAKRDLDFAVIRAPFDGMVGNKAVEAGAYVQPGSRIAALVPLNSVRVDANFKETQVEHMKVGQRVRIRVDAFPDRDILGTVETFSPASGSIFSLLPPDNATGNFTKIVQRLPVRIRVPEDVAREGLLRPGLSVTVSVDTRATEPVVPKAARPEPEAMPGTVAAARPHRPATYR